MYNFIIFEDDPVDADILNKALSHHFNTQRTIISGENGDIVTLLECQKLDCVFVDYNLGHKKGSDIVRRIRKINDILPIVMVTGQGSENVAVDSFRSGVTDYLIKGNEFNPLFKKSVENIIDNYHTKNILRHQRSEMKFLFKSLSHDLQEPVKKIIMFSHVLCDKKLSDDEYNQLLEMLNLSANDIEAVFRALGLYINSLSSSEFEESFVDISKVLETTINDYGPYFESIGIKLTYQDNIPNIYTYPDIFNVIIKTIIQHVVKEYAVDSIKSNLYLFYEMKKNRHSLCLKILREQLPRKNSNDVYVQIEHNIAFKLCRKILSAIGGDIDFNDEGEVKYISFSVPVIKEKDQV